MHRGASIGAARCAREADVIIDATDSAISDSERREGVNRSVVAQASATFDCVFLVRLMCRGAAAVTPVLCRRGVVAALERSAADAVASLFDSAMAALFTTSR